MRRILFNSSCYLSFVVIIFLLHYKWQQLHDILVTTTETERKEIEKSEAERRQRLREASDELQRGWCDEVPSSSRLPLQESWPPGAAEAKRGGARPIAVGIPSVKGKARKRTQQEINEAEEERRWRREGNRWEYEDLENPPRS